MVLNNEFNIASIFEVECEIRFVPSILLIGIGVNSFFDPLVDVLLDEFDLLRNFLTLFLLPLVEVIKRFVDDSL